MIELRIGWFAPHRCDGWRHWLFDGSVYYRAESPTASVDVTVLGFTLMLVAGWGYDEPRGS